MKVLIFGNKTDILDEGAKNVATNISRSLEETDDVLTIYQRKSWLPSMMLKAFRFKPDLVLSIHGPSTKTIGILYIYKTLCRCKSAVVAAQPHRSKLMLFVISILKPSILFAQSKYWNDKFESLGIRTKMLPNGVDTNKFTKASNEELLSEVREQVGVTKQDKVLLHIGPINYNRNHELLIKLSRETDWKIIIIGSTTAPFSETLFNKIKDSGIIAINEYFPNINLLYSVATYYIFPVKAKDGSIEFPLTVLEAMSSGCPVITTRFKGIPDFIEESETFRYFDTYEELISILNNNIPNTSNTNADKYSWSNIASIIKSGLRN